MLGTTLPGIIRNVGDRRNELLEAFSLCHFASQADGPIPQRVTDSYHRAFGITGRIDFPKVGVNPSFMAFRVEYPGRATQIIIAIEGIRSIGDLRNDCIRFFETASVGSYRGTVLGKWKDRATYIKNSLQANATWLEWTTHRHYALTVAGYSAGAAIAEVLAYMMLEANPTVEISLEKIASPRVGDADWNTNRRGLVNLRNFYYYGDPIWLYPRMVVDWGVGISLIPSITRNVWFEADPFVTSWADHDMTQRGYPVYGQVDALANLNRVFAPMDINNTWRYHYLDAYRWLFLKQAQAFPSTSWAWRIKHLENIGENNWQNFDVKQFNWWEIPKMYDANQAPQTVPDWLLRELEVAAPFEADNVGGEGVAGGGDDWGFVPAAGINVGSDDWAGGGDGPEEPTIRRFRRRRF